MWEGRQSRCLGLTLDPRWGKLKGEQVDFGQKAKQLQRLKKAKGIWLIQETARRPSRTKITDQGRKVAEAKSYRNQKCLKKT